MVGLVIGGSGGGNLLSLKIVHEFLWKAGVIGNLIVVEVDLFGDRLSDVLLHLGDGQTGIDDRR